MTDIAQNPAEQTLKKGWHGSDQARARRSKRYASERRFKLIGLLAIALAVGFLGLLLASVAFQAVPAFTYHYLNLPVDLNEKTIDPKGDRSLKTIGKANYDGLIRSALRAHAPFAKKRREKRTLYRLVSSGAGPLLRQEVLADPTIIGSTRKVPILVSDDADLYLKGLVTPTRTIAGGGVATPGGTSGKIELTVTGSVLATIHGEIANFISVEADKLAAEGENQERVAKTIETVRRGVADRLSTAADEADKTRLQTELSELDKRLGTVRQKIIATSNKAAVLKSQAADRNALFRLTSAMPSFVVKINGGAVKLTEISPASTKGSVLIPLNSTDSAAQGGWSIMRLDKPEGVRKISDREIVWIESLRDKGLITREFNRRFFTAGASREPELAGIWGAMVGSLFTMLVTMILSFPLGVLAAIYLEEFAPKNRWTRLIEVNINNLAAVPSIVFGLLGLAVFLNFFHLPRSAPVVGGMVLALMTLPTVIIAARAALMSVPPSIREAALGVGASRQQTVFHHVLPLAMPGILTGTIIGMARALGETAPLLMIGMVAFIVDIPGGPTDPATVLPVQIYMWADFPEPAFQQRNAAAILCLLGFLVLMNAAAVILRKRFERRW